MNVLRVLALVYFAIGAIWAAMFIASRSHRGVRIQAKATVHAAGLDPALVDNFSNLVRAVAMFFFLWPLSTYRLLVVAIRLLAMPKEKQQELRKQIASSRRRVEREER